jgi:outer membrane protein TolC
MSMIIRARVSFVPAAFVLAVLFMPLPGPAWAQELGASGTLVRLSDFAVLPAGPHVDMASMSERVTLDEAIALALDANRLATKPSRRQFVRESVTQAYAAVQRAQRALEIREEALRMCRELERLTIEQAQQAEAEAPSVVLEARAARVKAESDVLRVRSALGAWRRQLNHLIGRDPEVRLVVTGKPPAAIGWGVSATGR